jgi:hypothetical protein
MKPRLSSDPRTEPIPKTAQTAWGFGAPTTSKDSPAWKRLISLGLGAFSLWLLWCALAPVLHALFPGPKEVLKTEAAQAVHPAPAPNSAPRAELVPPRVLRALPVVMKALPVIGASYWATLPDGQDILSIYRGRLEHFSQLPAHPQLGDQFWVAEGPRVSWIWATPLGWNHPAWIDP